MGIYLHILAEPGRPVPVGNIGTVVYEGLTPGGEAVLSFTISRHIARKIARRAKPRNSLDRTRKPPHTDGTT